MTAYRALKAESQRTNIPVYYRTDLTNIDRVALSRNDAPETFGYCLREHGTELFRPGVRGTLAYAQSVVASTWNADSKRYYIYENNHLRNVSATTLINWLAKHKEG